MSNQQAIKDALADAETLTGYVSQSYVSALRDSHSQRHADLLLEQSGIDRTTLLALIGGGGLSAGLAHYRGFPWRDEAEQAKQAAHWAFAAIPGLRA